MLSCWLFKFVSLCLIWFTCCLRVSSSSCFAYYFCLGGRRRVDVAVFCVCCSCSCVVCYNITVLCLYVVWLHGCMVVWLYGCGCRCCRCCCCCCCCCELWLKRVDVDLHVDEDVCGGVCVVCDNGKHGNGKRNNCDCNYLFMIMSVICNL